MRIIKQGKKYKIQRKTIFGNWHTLQYESISHDGSGFMEDYIFMSEKEAKQHISSEKEKPIKVVKVYSE